MQAYDPVVNDADLELGVTDQMFNIFMDRNLQKAYGQEDRAAMFVPPLVGLDGKGSFHQIISCILTKYRNDNTMFIGNKVCIFNIPLDMQGFAHG